MKGLDLRKFKKLHSNEHTTTLMHPDGHKISIAHTKVKPELAEQLKSLPKFAEGGYVESAVKTLKEAFTEEPKPKAAPKPVIMPNAEDAAKMKKVFDADKYCGGGMVAPQKFADGGSVLDDTSSSGASGDWESDNSTPSLGQPLSQSSVTNEQQQAIQASSTPAALMASKPSMAEELKTEQQSKAPEQDIYSQVQQPQQVPMAMSQPNMSGQADQMMGIQKEANAMSAMGHEEVGAAKDQAQKMQDLQMHYEAQSQALQKEIENVTHDIQNGHIDPNHFWNSKSDVGKVSSAIGLILGGIGGGMTHQENPALKFLNAQIDRDIESQKMQMNNQHNLLSALNNQFGNLNDATKMAKAMYADVYAAKIGEAAAKSKDPVAQARAQQAIGQIKAATMPMMQELALKQTVMQGLHQGMLPPEAAVQHLVPKEHQKEVFGEIKKAQDATQNESAILSEFDKASKENTIMRRTFQHAGAEPASLANTRNLLMPILKDNEGRINETEIKMMEDFMPKAGDSENKIEQKRAGLQAFIQAKKSAPTAKGYGIDLSRMQGTQMSAPGFNRRK